MTRSHASVPLWVRFELPTWLVLALVYGGWLTLTLFFAELPLWLSLPAAVWLVAWHGSVQHEATHGHPTRSARVNAVVVGLPLWLWLPYGIYRESHLQHHRTPELTDPIADPESFWVEDAAWMRACPIRRSLHWINATLVGRLLVGPIIVVARFVADELARFARGDFSHLRHWLTHAVGVTLVLWWVSVVCEIPVAVYVLCFAYPGLALTLLRSYAEHRPSPDRAHRTAIIEAHPVWALLFLNNNLHALHHGRPHLPWFAYGGEYRRRREELVTASGNNLYSGYFDVLRRFAFQPRHHPRYTSN